jgi:hypothetical protein
VPAVQEESEPMNRQYTPTPELQAIFARPGEWTFTQYETYWVAFCAIARMMIVQWEGESVYYAIDNLSDGIWLSEATTEDMLGKIESRLTEAREQIATIRKENTDAR